MYNREPERKFNLLVDKNHWVVRKRLKPVNTHHFGIKIEREIKKQRLGREGSNRKTKSWLIFEDKLFLLRILLLVYEM